LTETAGSRYYLLDKYDMSGSQWQGLLESRNGQWSSVSALNRSRGNKHGKEHRGDGYRKGEVRDRSQVFNPKTETWTKRDDTTGQFQDQKADGTPFKGVRKEKT
jgi:hypothetical protein